MQAEIEVRFLDVSHDTTRAQLKAAGGECVQPMQLMKRAIMDYPDHSMRRLQPDHWAWVRVRDEGDAVRITYKKVMKNDTLDTHEIELKASSYDNAVALFEAIGLKNHSEQHTRRESWRLDDCEVLLDEWPWLPPIVEIEGPSEASIQKVAESLGLDWTAAQRGNVEGLYRQMYPGMGEEESISSIEVLTFEEMPEWLKERRRA